MLMVTIDAIVERAKVYLKDFNEQRLRRAYFFADQAHQGQTRFSGEPYIIHPLSVAYILLDFHPDEDTLIAALLHDVAEDTDRTIEEIEQSFGKQVSTLCFGVMKLSKVRQKLNDPHVENLRKLFLAMSHDFRVVLLKLCDRLHNMRTLDFVRPEKQLRIAQETINIYAPIAARLGIYRLKSELEDLCFKYLHPQDYELIKNQLSKSEKWRDQYIDSTRKILLEIMAKEGMQGFVDGRVKSIYSIQRKLQKKNKNSIDDIFDVFAMRIVLPDIYKHGKEYVGHVYTMLGIMHNHFTPLANRFKDYVAVPKVNGYRSLHTTVMGLGPKVHTQPTELQIRTNSMHHASEFGIAAHWLYEEGINLSVAQQPKNIDEAVATGAADIMAQHKQWISGLDEIQRSTKDNQEFLDHLKRDIFQDRIFVLTPRGDVLDLPKGATPIDFAYGVHSEIGDKCIGAKVNGSIVPLDRELKNGEVVEILTKPAARPNQQWLSFVKTSHAKNRIRSWVKNLDEEKHLREGKRLLNEKLKQLGKQPLDPELSVLRTYGTLQLSMKDREDLVREIGMGEQLASHVVRKIFSLPELFEISKKSQKIPFVLKPKSASVTDRQHTRLSIGGAPNMPYQFVKCCDAKAGDELVGFVTRGRGVSIHKKKCSVLRGSESQRLVSVVADGKAPPYYLVHICVNAQNRLGLVRDITQIIAENKINIFDLYSKDMTPELTELHFIVEIENFDQFESVLCALEKIPSVRRAVKVN